MKHEHRSLGWEVPPYSHPIMVRSDIDPAKGAENIFAPGDSSLAECYMAVCSLGGGAGT